MALTEVAGIIAMASLALVVCSLGYLHLVPTGLSPVRNAVSQYGIGPYAAGYRVATIAFAVAGAALAVGVQRSVTGPGCTTVVVLLGIFAVARAVISWFPMDAPQAAATTTGRRHRVLAAAAFVSVGAAAFRLSGALAGQQRWHDLAGVSSAFGWAMLAAVLGMAMQRSVPTMRAYFGAIERAFYGAAIAWCALLAFAFAAILS